MTAAVAVPDPIAFPSGAAGALPTVLIVADERKTRWRLIEQFRAFGIAPHTAWAGWEAIRIAGEQRPDLILVDGLLPEMHRFELARCIRHLDDSYRPTIVVMAAIYKQMRYLNEPRLRYGVDDYLAKPLTDDAVATLIETVQKERDKCPARF